jgi:hypothetical protein
MIKSISTLDLLLPTFSNLHSALGDCLAVFFQYQLSPRVRSILLSGCVTRDWSFSLLRDGQRNLKVYLYIPEAQYPYTRHSGELQPGNRNNHELTGDIYNWKANSSQCSLLSSLIPALVSGRVVMELL